MADGQVRAALKVEVLSVLVGGVEHKALQGHIGAVGEAKHTAPAYETVRIDDSFASCNRDTTYNDQALVTSVHCVCS